ncbi:ABC transporter substrate-binding protein [Actinopolymorpha rutila]|uniref:Peptide/nickel transport system substrate-binding protein n=1 Tax=Actinopolymorpha rutila TaxID=446787 RepID=A0A852ZWT5_9ACTN|nr:ABC transporter substrate-binding protein [Actinopolymorpha rutila]NYH93176.1 peptide/nickel transport system substrate-binding protein [Actinopolymorpha rutila]
MSSEHAHHPSRLSRRAFLHGSAVAAGAAMLAACSGGDATPAANGGPAKSAATGKGSSTKALPTPKSFSESPLLAKQVKAGSLPKVGDRLPANPYVLPHNWLRRGKYGGNLRLIVDDTASSVVKEYMYGHSPLRWLNDALDVGPGLAESWDTNADQTEWTLHLRKGLRWSDGEPCTAADIMFWWKDMVLDERHPEVAPAELIAADHKVAELSAPDDLTVRIKFSTSAPLTAAYIANWVKNGNGPTWIVPKHYLVKYHPAYTGGLGEKWVDTFESKRNFGINPDCPTMTGWRLKSYREGRTMVWERNPYYWCVTPDGDQLPYVDTLTFTAVADPQVTKLRIQNGDTDYVHGTFANISLADVSGLKQAAKKSKLNVLLWDSGSGCGSLFFFNLNYKDPAIRKVLNEPKFRQALSLGVDRAEVQKAVFFNTGYKTTGTYSLKASDCLADPEGKKTFEAWRDSYSAHDVEKAKKLLDEIGVVDRDGDGLRDLPDGGRFRLRLDQAADVTGDGDKMGSLLQKYWKALGLDVMRNPVPPAQWSVKWQAGELMAYTAWMNPAMPVHECLVSPELLVPVGNGLSAAFWAPLYANYDMIRNTPEEKKVANADPYKRNPPSEKPPADHPVTRLWEIYDKARVETDALKRFAGVWDMIKIHISHGPFYMGVVGNYPCVELAHQELGNVPARENLKLNGLIAPWQHPTPAAYDPEAFYWTNPAAHT